MVDAPDAWRLQYLEKGFLILGDIRRAAVSKPEIFALKKEEPKVVWIKAAPGLPPGLRSREALEYLLFDYGKLLSWDIPHFLKSPDKSVRAKMEIPSFEILPPNVWCQFIKKSGDIDTFQVLFTILSVVPKPSGRPLTWERNVESKGIKTFGAGIPKVQGKGKGAKRLIKLNQSF